MCTHKPLSAEDCIPQKSLRLTCKAFLKSELKKRNKSKEDSAPKPAPPTLQALTPSASGIVASTENQSASAESSNQGNSAAQAVDADSHMSNADGGQDRSQNAANVKTPRRYFTNEAKSLQNLVQQRDPNSKHGQPGDDSAATNEQEREAGANDEKHGQTEQENIDGNQNEMTTFNGHDDQSQQSAFAQGFGLDGNQQNFSGMDWSNAGNFNMMQMQMQMQNAMQSGNWNGFPNMMGKRSEP